MTVRQMTDEMQLTPLTCPDPERVVTGGYVGDLLSWVMGRARSGQAWITIMSNINTVAVASLADVACVILAEGVTLPEDVQRMVLPVLTHRIMPNPDAKMKGISAERILIAVVENVPVPLRLS